MIKVLQNKLKNRQLVDNLSFTVLKFENTMPNND